MKDKWFEVKKVREDIYVIDDHGESSIYLVLGKKTALVIDTGWGIGNLRELVNSITELPLIVVNTHGHPDHVGGDYSFPDIHIAGEDIPLLSWCYGKENRKTTMNYILNDSFPEDFSPQEWIDRELMNIVPIQDGHIFNLGGKKIEITTIPGHTPGGIGLLDIENRILFSGDTVLEGTIWLHLDESLSLAEYQNTLYKLKNSAGKFDYILPGHGIGPLDKEIIDELITGVGDIISGKRKGEYHHTFAGDGLLCQFKTTGVVYTEDKL